MTWKSKLLMLSLLALQASHAFAQPGGGGDPGHGSPVPVGGVELLLIAGGILGLRSFWKATNKVDGKK